MNKTMNLCPRHENNRNVVLWLGSGLPSAFVEACKIQGLSVQPVDAFSFQTSVPEARAAIFSIPPGTEHRHFAEALRPAVNSAHDNGLLIGLIAETAEDALPTVDETALVRVYEVHKALGENMAPGTLIRVQHDWPKVAKMLKDHEPSHGSNSNLIIRCSDPLIQEDKVLLQRAFTDRTEVDLVPLQGGQSGAVVWLVKSKTAIGAARPVVAKVDDVSRIQTELANYRILAETIDSSLRAPLDVARCVSVGRRAIAVYDLVDRATPLSTSLSSTVLLVHALFAETMLPLHRHGHRGELLRGELLRGELLLSLFNWNSALEDAAADAAKMSASCLSISETKNKLARLSIEGVIHGAVHGDLHIGNCFSRGTDVVIIDYASVRTGIPIAWDLATFETSLTFPSRDALRPPREWLEVAYTAPLSHDIPEGPASCNSLAKLLREIRLRVVTLAPSMPAYEALIATRLLRFASFADNGTLEDRALAFLLASSIIRRIDASPIG